MIRFKLDIREPYMGNTVPLEIEVDTSLDPPEIKVWTPEGIIHVSRAREDERGSDGFNH